MADLTTLKDALAPVLARVAELDLTADDAAAQLAQDFPVDGEGMQDLKRMVREGVEQGWLCDRENGGVRFSRVQKSVDGALSVDAVNMKTPGPGHTHPNGEVDLCFSVSGAPTFDGNPEGWTVYPPGSWHIPTVDGGEMDILYFLPGGAIEFGPKT